jgi:hypothetical protein
MMRLYAYLASLMMVVRERGRDEEDNDRGDVPGWVMVTVMTAILVVAILAIFEPQIKSALSGIIDSISGKN